MQINQLLSGLKKQIYPSFTLSGMANPSNSISSLFFLNLLGCQNLGDWWSLRFFLRMVTYLRSLLMSFLKAGLFTAPRFDPGPRPNCKRSWKLSKRLSSRKAGSAGGGGKNGLFSPGTPKTTKEIGDFALNTKILRVHLRCFSFFSPFREFSNTSVLPPDCSVPLPDRSKSRWGLEWPAEQPAVKAKAGWRFPSPITGPIQFLTAYTCLYYAFIYTCYIHLVWVFSWVLYACDLYLDIDVQTCVACEHLCLLYINIYYSIWYEWICVHPLTVCLVVSWCVMHSFTVR